MKIQITGRIPSKKNSKRIVRFGKRIALIPSKEHKAWHEEKITELLKNKPAQPIEKCEIEMYITFPDKRASDLSNKAESIMDLLVDAGYIKDDNHLVVGSLVLKSLGVDKNNCGCNIIINEIYG